MGWDLPTKWERMSAHELLPIVQEHPAQRPRWTTRLLLEGLTLSSFVQRTVMVQCLDRTSRNSVEHKLECASYRLELSIR